jgi:hypothetical protein
MNLDIPTSTTAEDEVQDHQAVENLLQPRGKTRESSNLTRERNDYREHSEGYVPAQERADDAYNISEDEEMITTVQKGKQKMV